MKVNPEKIPDGIRDSRIAIIGYGLLGRPIAQCLRDSGHDIRIGLGPESNSRGIAESDKFETGSIAEAASWADAVLLHIPDDQQGAVYSEHLESTIQNGSILILAHGYAFLYEYIKPKETIDAVVIAPHGPGETLRQFFLEGKGLAAQIAVHQDSTGEAEIRALMLAKSMGHHLGGIWITSVEDEVIMDHFSEQIVLCGGVVELMRAALKTLIDAGYDPESAYESIVRELKYTVDIIHEVGPDGLYRKISKSALVGSLLHGHEAIGDDALKRMKRVLDDIKSGEFRKKFEAITSGKIGFDIDKILDDREKDFKK